MSSLRVTACPRRPLSPHVFIHECLGVGGGGGGRGGSRWYEPVWHRDAAIGGSLRTGSPSAYARVDKSQSNPPRESE